MTHAKPPPSLGALFLCFLRIGAVSFGSGMMPWIRQAVVQRLEWVDDRVLLSGVALSQIAPGPNGVNLAVYIGTVLRGAAGACVALGGMLALPVVFLLAAGWAYSHLGLLPSGSLFGAALSGMGAAAIGLMLANGVRLTPRNVQGARGWGVMLAVAIAIGAFRLPLLPVLAAAVPLSLLLTFLEPRGARA
ncbi:MAG: chromate transporter [Acetobacteraceae bacterium]|nr:chromate transporter [Acetobacteraceae bacterium]